VYRPRHSAAGVPCMRHSANGAGVRVSLFSHDWELAARSRLRRRRSSDDAPKSGERRDRNWERRDRCRRDCWCGVRRRCCRRSLRQPLVCFGWRGTGVGDLGRRLGGRFGRDRWRSSWIRPRNWRWCIWPLDHRRSPMRSGHGRFPQEVAWLRHRAAELPVSEAESVGRHHPFLFYQARRSTQSRSDRRVTRRSLADRLRKNVTSRPGDAGNIRLTYPKEVGTCRGREPC
jgi:hypothetical protein